MTAGADPGRLAHEMARTARWSGHLSRSERRTALRLWLANRLAGQPRDSVRQTIEDLAKIFRPPPAPQPVPEGVPEPKVAEGSPVSAEPAPSAAVEALIGFAKKVYGSGWKPAGSLSADAALRASASDTPPLDDVSDNYVSRDGL